MMKLARRTLLLAALAAGIALPAHAQQTMSMGVVVSSCGTAPVTYTAGQTRMVTMNTSGQLCSAAASTPSGTQAVTIVDGGSVTLGAKADAKSTATDTTAITAMQVLKQISASVQAPPSQAVTNAGTFAVQNTPAGWSYTNISTNTSTQAKSGAGVLHTVTINTKGITNVVTVYDNTSCATTVIATIDSTLSQETLIFDASFATGLCIKTAGGTAADLTATWR